MTIETAGPTASYLSRSQAAAYLNMSSKWLATNLQDGPRFHKFGASVRYSVAELDRWASEQLVSE